MDANERKSDRHEFAYICVDSRQIPRTWPGEAYRVSHHRILTRYFVLARNTGELFPAVAELLGSGDLAGTIEDCFELARGMEMEVGMG